ncbi:hypothetical protein DYB26_013341, partial [Aphanomyces astaci]
KFVFAYILNLMKNILCFNQQRIVFNGQCGVHDSTVWASAAPALQPLSYFDPDQYQAGDSGFPLSRHMLTPYRLPSAREVGNDIFNTGHASLRVVMTDEGKKRKANEIAEDADDSVEEAEAPTQQVEVVDLTAESDDDDGVAPSEDAAELARRKAD